MSKPRKPKKHGDVVPLFKKPPRVPAKIMAVADRVKSEGDWLRELEKSCWEVLSELEPEDAATLLTCMVMRLLHSKQVTVDHVLLAAALGKGTLDLED